MNTSNKLMILSAIVCVSTLVILSLSFIKSSNSTIDSAEPKAKTPIADVKNAESNISPKMGEKAEREKYLIRLSDGEIKAYIVDEDGGELMWNSIKPPPDLSEGEKSELTDGIYTDSFEELCLYFEAYAS